MRASRRGVVDAFIVMEARRAAGAGFARLAPQGPDFDPRRAGGMLQSSCVHIAAGIAEGPPRIEIGTGRRG